MWKRRALIVFVLVLLVVVSGFLIKENNRKKDIPVELFCEDNGDCIPEEACHSSNCVGLGYEESRDGIFCSQECSPGTLDCGQGSCECVKNRCGAVFNE